MDFFGRHLVGIWLTIMVETADGTSFQEDICSATYIEIDGQYYLLTAGHCTNGFTRTISHAECKGFNMYLMQEINKSQCQACLNGGATLRDDSFDGVQQLCPRCGEFRISRTAIVNLQGTADNESRAILSGWIRDQYTNGAIPEINSYNLDTILARAVPSIAERAALLLKEAERGTIKLGDRFNTTEPRFLAATYSSQLSDVSYLMGLLDDQGLAEYKAMGGEAEILPRGYVKLDEMRTAPSKSSQGFVAMWFGVEMDAAYTEGLEAGVFRAGYDPLRIDAVEHINKIDDEIIAQINASKFLVADFTGHRGGVYFEAGYAMGKDLPIFWTCRKDHLSELHFDIRQFNCIDWESPEELAQRLSIRLEAVLGAGPNKP